MAKMQVYRPANSASSDFSECERLLQSSKFINFADSTGKAPSATRLMKPLPARDSRYARNFGRSLAPFARGADDPQAIKNGESKWMRNQTCSAL